MPALGGLVGAVREADPGLDVGEVRDAVAWLSLSGNTQFVVCIFSGSVNSILHVRLITVF